MSLSAPFPWQADFAAAWAARRNAWPHGLLLHGPAGFGKRALAGYFAKLQLCESPGSDGAPCGACPGCAWIEQRQHPDLRWVEPATAGDEETETKARAEVIRIEQIRELGDFVMLTSHRQGRKVIVVSPAEAMNAAAANGLLKTLEEPPSATQLILVSDRPGRLPATILSRCTKLAAPRPKATDAAAWLRAQGIAEPADALAQAAGAPLVALQLAAPGYQEERRYFLGQLAVPSKLSAVALGTRLDACPKPERKARLTLWLDLLATWTYDLAALAAGSVSRYHPDFCQAASGLASKLAPLPLIRYHRQVLLQKRLIGHPLTPRLVAEQMLQAYREAIVAGMAG